MSLAKKINLDDAGFETLILQALQEVEDDMKDVNANVDLYKAAVAAGTFGLEQYGELYNEALKVKGSVRDRLLKILTLIKDRVKTKEIYSMAKKDGSSFSAEEVKSIKTKVDALLDNEIKDE